jgi:hypothetical protein
MIALTLRSPKLARMASALISLTVLLSCFGGAARAFGAEAPRPFAAFNAKVEIDIEDGEVEVWAGFTPAAGGKGVDLSTQTVSLQVKGGTGAYSVTFPAGSFKKDGSGTFKFQGTINRVKIESLIRPARDGGYDFEIQTEGASLKGIANPITVNLTVGDDGGSKTVRAKIE